MRQLVSGWEPPITTTRATRTPYLSIVIPAFNEASRLPSTLSRLHGYLRAQPYTWEILVVSNGSTDATVEVVERAAGEIEGLRSLGIRERGKGIACRTGVLASAGDVVFLCDADLSMPPETLERFLAAVGACDIVVGSREAPGAMRYSEPWLRHLMGRVFNHLVRMFAVAGIRDTQCGFKAFRRPVALHLFELQTLTGFGFDVELLFLARKHGYTLEELPIDWYFDADSRVRPGTDTLNMVSEVVMIRVRNALGKYETPAATPAGAGESIAP